MANQTPVGTNVTALIRDLLVQYGNLPYSEAQKIADKAEEDHLSWVDWLSTSTGLTFDRGFDPKKK